MVTSGKIGTGKGPTKTAISSVSKLSEHKAVRESQREAGNKRSDSKNSDSVNSEFAYSVDASNNYKVSYDSEALQSKNIGQALNNYSNSTASPYASALAPNSLASTGAWLGGGAALGGGGLSGGGSLGGGLGGGGGNQADLSGDLRGHIGGNIGAGIGEMDAAVASSRGGVLDDIAKVTSVNATTSGNYAYMTGNGGYMTQLLRREVANNGKALGEVVLALHGKNLGSQVVTTAGASIPANAGTEENKANAAVFLADLNHGQHGSWFANDFRNFKAAAIKSGVPEENIFLASNLGQYKSHLSTAAKINEENGGGGGLMLGQANHGWSSGAFREHTANAASSFVCAGQSVSEGNFETMNSIAKLKGEFDWAVSFNGSCFSGGFDGTAEVSGELVAEAKSAAEERSNGSIQDTTNTFDFSDKVASNDQDENSNFDFT